MHAPDVVSPLNIAATHGGHGTRGGGARCRASAMHEPRGRVQWDMSASAAAEAFPSFWNVLGQVTNTVVFFFSGAACVNFLLRSTAELQAEGYGSALAVTLWRLPIIFLAAMAVRMLLIALFSPMLNLFGAKLDWRVRRPHLPYCHGRPALLLLCR